MKKLLLLVLISFLSPHTKSQVVFCPPGAEWSYNFGQQGPPNSALEKIIYTKDSVLGLDTVKFLKHTRFFLSCNGGCSPTLIKQKGDTIFMRNACTDNNWEILYNFNVQSGQTWETDIKLYSMFSNGLTTITYTVFVDSVGFVTENGINLKRLYVKYKRPDISGQPAIITERLGCNIFLFNYSNFEIETACDADWLQRALCYTDPQFGTIQYTSFPCDYVRSMFTGLEELNNEIFSIYPNPTSNYLTIENTSSSQFLQVEIIDLLGKIIQKQSLESSQNLDVSSLQNGIYFLKAYDKNKLIATEKFAKE